LGTTDLLAYLAVSLLASGLGAPAPAPPPAPPAAVLPWELKLGLSYLATTGNTDTSSTGFDAGFRKEWVRWALEGNAAGVATTRNDRNTAESYNVQVRARRKVRRARRPQLTAGLRAERNRFAGLDYRAGADVSALWQLREGPRWKLSLVAGLTLNREEPRGRRPITDSFGGILQLSGDGRISESSTWDSQITFFPRFDDPDDYRVHSRVGLQAAINRHLGIRLGNDLKYDHEPVRGFRSTDTTTNVSLVVQLGHRR
jgi:putative salt-induced outer membrane protein YdiY